MNSVNKVIKFYVYRDYAIFIFLFIALLFIYPAVLVNSINKWNTLIYLFSNVLLLSFFTLYFTVSIFTELRKVELVDKNMFFTELKDSISKHHGQIFIDCFIKSFAFCVTSLSIYIIDGFIGETINENKLDFCSFNKIFTAKCSFYFEFIRSPELYLFFIFIVLYIAALIYFYIKVSNHFTLEDAERNIMYLYETKDTDFNKRLVFKKVAIEKKITSIIKKIKFF